MPQVHILLVLYKQNDRVLFNGVDILDITLFYATTGLSIISASFGIANFLRNGPCRLIPDEGSLGSFLLLIINVGTALVSKALMFQIIWMNLFDPERIMSPTLTWILTFYIAHAVYVS